MDNTTESLYNKLNSIIDTEFEKDIEVIDADLVDECADGILRLVKEQVYQITAKQRQNSIQSIISQGAQKKKMSKVAKVLLAAAIIMILLIGTVFAYTIIKYNINDLGINSDISANITPAKSIDTAVEPGYMPEGYELADEVEMDWISQKVFFKGEDFIIIEKSCSNKWNVNTEYQKAVIKNIDGREYIFYGEDEHGKGIMWFTSKYCYDVEGYISDSELLKIAQNLR